MEWKTVESNERPSELDKTSSKVYNYIRRNIAEKTRKDEMSGDSIVYYEYEECKILKADWALYEGVSDNTANIDYLAMMTGIEL